ncbi:MAG: Ig-like domain-containing protein [Candidatus Micrarchaeota archaeon]|nr:Ig-like domain-containing protein [Candidatus Micrarchaeota archaeon]
MCETLAQCNSLCDECYPDPEMCPVANTAPVIGTVSFLPNPLWSGQTFNCSAIVSDADGLMYTVTYKAWDGGSSEGSPDHSGSMSCPGSYWATGKNCSVTNVAEGFATDGTITCKIFANDYYVVVTKTGTSTYREAPVVTLTSPENGSTDTDGNISLACSFTDNTALKNVSLLTNRTGQWAADGVNFSYLTGTSGSWTFNLTGVSDGQYVWNCHVNDTSGNKGYASSNRTIIVNVPPAVSNLSLASFQWKWANDTWIAADDTDISEDGLPAANVDFILGIRVNNTGTAASASTAFKLQSCIGTAPCATWNDSIPSGWSYGSGSSVGNASWVCEADEYETGATSTAATISAGACRGYYWHIRGYNPVEATEWQFRLATSSGDEISTYTQPDAGVTLVYTVSSLTFTLSYPSSGCNESKGCATALCSVCTRAWIETTDTSGPAEQTCVAPQGQTPGTPFLDFWNTGNVPLNWTVQLNETLPTQYSLKIKSSVDDCATSTAITMSEVVVNSSVATGQNAYAWLYGDFMLAPVGNVSRNITHTSYDGT